MVTIWFESHGTTPDNEAKVASGWNDVDLSELGKRRASEMLARCQDRNLAAIFCSDLQRSYKSAQPTATALHLPVYMDEALRECNYGDMEGAANDLITAERPHRISQPFPGGESYEQCLERMQPFFARLSKKFSGQTVLIIGHRATFFGVEYFAAGTPLEISTKAHWKWQPGWQYQLK